MEFKPTKDAGSGAMPWPIAEQLTALTVWPAGQVTGSGNCGPGPGFKIPLVSPAETAPKSRRLSATLDAEPYKTPYFTANPWSVGSPVANKELTAVACGPVNCTESGPLGVGRVTGSKPKLSIPMLENPVSSRRVSS